MNLTGILTTSQQEQGYRLETDDHVATLMHEGKPVAHFGLGTPAAIIRKEADDLICFGRVMPEAKLCPWPPENPYLHEESRRILERLAEEVK